MEPIKVLIVDDHQLVRDGIHSTIAREDQGLITVIGEAISGEEAILLATKLHPDVVIMDVEFKRGEMNGFQACRRIREHNFQTKVLFLTFHDEPVFVKNFPKWLGNGYVNKSSVSKDLIRGIFDVHSGKTYVSTPIFEEPGGLENEHELTTQEGAVLRLLGSGMTSKEIALELDTSVKTVEKHREHIREKLNLHTIAELTAYAISQGMIYPTMNQIPEEKKPD